jgi:uncharacterized protein YbjQ (UPF0145 family)
MTGVVIFLVLLLLGFVFGKLAEKRHFRSLERREKLTANLPAVNMKVLPVGLGEIRTRLVSGNVVISIDYYKKVLSWFRSIFGGQLRSYETLLERARREAILRMKGACKMAGGKVIVNVRIETASINRYSQNRSSVGSVEVFAYGTAIIPVNLNKL